MLTVPQQTVMLSSSLSKMQLLLFVHEQFPNAIAFICVPLLFCVVIVACSYPKLYDIE